MNTEDDTIDSIIYNENAIRYNMSLLDYCRTTISALSGSTAGVLGLTSLYGFAFYILATLFLSLFLYHKTSTNSDTYFRSKFSIVTEGFLNGLFTFVLFWTFLYGMNIGTIWCPRCNNINALAHLEDEIHIDDLNNSKTKTCFLDQQVDLTDFS